MRSKHREVYYEKSSVKPPKTWELRPYNKAIQDY